MTDATNATLQKFLRSAEAKRILEAEERRHEERRAAAQKRLEEAITTAEGDHETALAQMDARIAIATQDYEEAQAVFVEKQRRLTDLVRQRLRESFSSDATIEDLRARLRAVRDGTAEMDDD